MKRKKVKKSKFTASFIVIIICLFISYAIISGKGFINNITFLENLLFAKFYYLFFTILNITLIVLLILAFSKYGKYKIGGTQAKPEYSNIAWYAMLFSAGMGIGIMFYAVSEPLAHNLENPLFNSSSPMVSALATTYFSWGIHAWIIYVLIGLAFAFFAHNKGLPLSLRSLFYPVLKDKIYGKIGDIIDGCGAIITLFALASSLALGSMQINSGLNYLIGVNNSITLQILIIIVVIIIATISIVSGLDKGVRILSELNLNLATILGIILLICGPTILIIKNLLTSSALYFSQLPLAAIQINSVDLTWSKTWTIFYMAWWISWSIFVGIFIAKISKGRTIREFILSILFIPTILVIIWFGILGTDAIYTDQAGALSAVVSQDISLSLFGMIDLLIKVPLIKVITQVLSLLIIILFFVTSSDSGSLVVGSLAGGGNKISNFQKIFWSLMQCILAITIIIAGGIQGVDLIQSILIIISLPLTIFLLYVLISLILSIIRFKAKD
ncbi:MAG: BCCT family transporter [Mycoplasmatales bacterium]